MTEVEGVEVPTEHYIDGRRVASADTFEVRSPIDWAELEARGRRAAAAPPRSMPPWPPRAGRSRPGPLSAADGRRAALTRLADAIDAAVPRLAAVECVDNGSIHEAMEQRVLPRAANNVRFFADYAAERLAEPPRTLHGGERNRVRRRSAAGVAVSDDLERAVHARHVARRPGARGRATPWCSSRRSGRR